MTLTCLAASFAVLVIGLVVFFTVRTIRQNDTAADLDPTVITPDGAARAVGGVGPPPGVDLATYGETRKAALAEASGERVAVVSLTKYTTEARARAAVGSASVVALLAAAPGGQPSVVTGDVASWVSSQTAEARAERDEIEKLIPTARNDPAFQSFYRSEVDRLNTLIASVKPDGELVFGVVVKAPVGTLRELAARSDVRLVDVGPAEPLSRPDYRGVRPEETEKANEPNTRPV